MEQPGRTMLAKIWDQHVIAHITGDTDLLHVDRHLLHDLGGSRGLLDLKGRGTLAVGSFADVVIFDPHEEWAFHAKNSKSKSKNTPFDGWTMQGRVHWTISEGRVVYMCPPVSG